MSLLLWGRGWVKFKEFYEESKASRLNISQNSILNRILEEQPVKTVGGSFQGAWVDAERFVLSPRLTFEEEKPKVVLIGEDITDMRLMVTS